MVLATRIALLPPGAPRPEPRCPVKPRGLRTIVPPLNSVPGASLRAKSKRQLAAPGRQDIRSRRSPARSSNCNWMLSPGGHRSVYYLICNRSRQLAPGITYQEFRDPRSRTSPFTSSWTFFFTLLPSPKGLRGPPAVPVRQDGRRLKACLLACLPASPPPPLRGLASMAGGTPD